MTDAVTSTERWFVDHGLPAFTRRRLDGSARKAAAVLVLVAALEAALLAPSDAWPWWLDLLAVLVVPAGACTAVAAAVRAEARRPHGLGRWLADAAFVAVPAVLGLVLSSLLTAGAVVALNLMVLGLVGLEQRFRFLAVLRWCLRHARGQVRQAAGRLSRSVPLLTVVVLALFYTSEVWQAAAGLRPANLAAVVGILGAAGVLFAVGQARSGVTELAAGRDVVTLLAGTPAADLPPAKRERTPLTRLEEANVNVLLVVSQMCVVAATALMFASIIVVLGSVAIPLDVLTGWLGAEPKALLDLHVGLELHLTRELIALGAVMAGIAGLVFAVSLAGDEGFQDFTRQELAEELAVAFAARDRYIAGFHTA